MTDQPPGAQLTDVEEYAAAVLDVVRRIPSGRAMTYGLIAEIVGEELGRGGPRQVGSVMAGSGDRYAHLVPDDDAGRAGDGDPDDGGRVPWWRVVNAAGSPPQQHLTKALDALRAEGCPLSRDGARVNLRRAVWFPEDAAEPAHDAE
ncbi:MGMT family protein [Promicromonospora panici]|uniref:MGMT family protein n=1 Tax=Promicromonospora panici TaxID=2219658 RepID=UPI00241432CD|nr:MGMT family protein [Promicromonospora panici]